MAWGAVLGIIAGIMVAVYALPPILRSIYGEEELAYREAYDAEGRRIEVTAVERIDGVFFVHLDVRTNQTWTMTEDDWQLEVTTQDDWLAALAPDPGVPETSFELSLAETRRLVLRFKAPNRVDAEPVALHLSDPRLGFALRPE